eukprot:14572125-Heterocapsa_arctica.AAC.1
MMLYSWSSSSSSWVRVDCRVRSLRYPKTSPTVGREGMCDSLKSSAMSLAQLSGNNIHYIILCMAKVNCVETGTGMS